MKINLVVPHVNRAPTHRPRACVYCGRPIFLHRHGTVSKPIKDHPASLGSSPTAINASRAAENLQALPGRDHQEGAKPAHGGLGGFDVRAGTPLLRAASHLLGALGAEVGKITVWRDAQEAAGEALRGKRPAGRVRVLGADETVFGVRGRGR